MENGERLTVDGYSLPDRKNCIWLEGEMIESRGRYQSSVNPGQMAPI
jgi:hypothetical protein